MLEGSDKSSWYLWGFSSEKSSYFECHDTRSGDVASDILIESDCKYLVSDVYSGYNKAISVCNKYREENRIAPVQSCYCNAHARRKFKEISEDIGNFFIEKYQKIYKVEKEIKNQLSEIRSRERLKLRTIFEEMKSKAAEILDTISSKSSEAQAMN